MMLRRDGRRHRTIAARAAAVIVGIVIGVAVPFSLAAETPVVAVVGSARIALSDFSALLSRMRHAGDYGTTVQTLTPSGRRRILSSLVQQRVRGLAAREAGLDQQPSVKFELEQAQADVLARALVDSKSRAVTDEAARAYYDMHPAEFRSVARVNARHILLRTREEAERVRDELASGASFETLAKTRSIDPNTKDNGGRLGWIARGVMVKEFEVPLFKLKPAELSQVVATSHGYHVIRVDEWDAGAVPPFDAIKDDVRQAIVTHDIERLESQLTKKYGVTIDPAVLAQLDK
jgi:peptidyl-prolyl cis-trans isomerase C